MTNHWFTGIARNTGLQVLMAAACTLQLVADSGPSLTLLWEPSPSTDVVAYRLFYAVQPNAYEPGGCGPWGSVTVTNGNVGSIPGLIRGVVYYIAATAVDTQGNESDYSNVVEWTAPGIKSSPPAITLTYGASSLVEPADITIRVAIETNRNQLHGIACHEESTQQLLSTNDFFIWQQVPAGEYDLQATVCYNHGLSVTSTPVVISVREPASQPMPERRYENSTFGKLALTSGTGPTTACAGCAQVAAVFHSRNLGKVNDKELAAFLLMVMDQGQKCCQYSALGLCISLVQQEPPSESRWILLLPASKTRTQLISAVVRSWAPGDPQGIAQWISKLPESDQQSSLDVLEHVLLQTSPSGAESADRALLN
jgi:hypothetical protein